MYGHGGVTVLSKATGLSRSTIHRGLRELESKNIVIENIRKSGGGRKQITNKDQTLLSDLQSLL